MVNGFRYYRALESISIALALFTALTIYPCEIRVHQCWQSKLPTSYSSEGVVAGHSGQFTPCGYLSTLWYTLGLEPATFRSLVDCWSNALPVVPPTHPILSHLLIINSMEYTYIIISNKKTGAVMLQTNTHKMNTVQPSLGAFVSKRFNELWTENITGVVGSKIPVVKRLSYESIIFNHVA